MHCKQIAEQDVLERYLLDQLAEQERDEFERHYFECESCFAQLQTALAVQEEVRHQRPSVSKTRGNFLRGTWVWTPALVTALLLFVVGTWWYSGRRRQNSAPVALQQPATNPAPSISPSSPSLEQLASVEPPPYLATTLRAVQDQAHEQFRIAMQNYSKGDYANAIPGIRAALKVDPKALSFNFYLAACYLLTGQTDPAITFFRKTIALGDPTYSEQSHFYLAKAYLKKQDVAGAEDELEATISFHGGKETEAGEILRQLRK